MLQQLCGSLILIPEQQGLPVNFLAPERQGLSVTVLAPEQQGLVGSDVGHEAALGQAGVGLTPRHAVDRMQVA